MKLYDKQNKRLIVVQETADRYFWDMHWQRNYLIEAVRAGKNNRLIKKFATRFLQPGAKVLEGGCGIGQNVYALDSWGYQAYGVDFASKTIERVKDKFPDLNMSIQDVRRLDFPGNFFDGYLSLGVIEHLWEGYDDILTEMKRVIRRGGYLFLSFPYFSALRKVKAWLGFYEILEGTEKIDDFYEFILDAEKVEADVEKYGFTLVFEHPFDATKGLKDEIYFLKPALQKVYDSQNVFARGTRFLNSTLFYRMASHSILLVFQNEE